MKAHAWSVTLNVGGKNLYRRRNSFENFCEELTSKVGVEGGGDWGG